MEYADYLKTGTMLPVGTLDPEEERRKREAAALGTRMPPVMPAQPSSAPSAANTMPAVHVASAPRSDASRTSALSLDAVRAAMAAASDRGNAMPPANVTELSPRAKMLAIGAAARPVIPPPRTVEATAPDISAGPAMPPVRVNPGQPVAPVIPAATPTALPPVGRAAMAETPAVQPGVMPAVKVGPLEKAYEDLAAQGVPKLSGWKKVLDTIGQIFPLGRAIETAIPGSPQNYDARLMQAAVRAAKEQTLGRNQAEEQRAEQEFPVTQRLRTAQAREAEARAAELENPKPDDPLDKKVDEYTNDKGQRVLTFQRANGEVYDRVGGQTQPKSSGHTSPFEAFAYGDAQERKAAQDFLDLEKRLGSRYRTPSEFEEKYRLFKEDPETYKAMFGDKAGTPDRATATKMLNYFDRRRREINQDFTLDDNQKQEQLKDIENLEKPFLDAVQPGAKGDRVKVIAPDGTPGTVPRSQLNAAKKKHYRVAE